MIRDSMVRSMLLRTRFPGHVARHTLQNAWRAVRGNMPREHGAGVAYPRLSSYYFFEAANCLRLHNDEFAAYYQSKYREARSHHHKRACVLTARKLVRLVFRLLRDGVLYKTPDQRKEYRAAHPLPEGTTPGELARHIQRRRQAKKAFRVHVDH
jgi:hypothetical protein